MNRAIFALLCVAAGASPAAGQPRAAAPTLVAVTNRGVLAAQRGSVALYDRMASNTIWSGESVQTPTHIVASNDQAAIIDSLANAVRIVDLATGRGTTIQTAETPIDGAFVNRRLYLLERDARALERVGTDGARASISVAADPALLRESNGRLYVYSRTAGVLQEITTSPFAISRSVSVAPFASDLEVDGRNAYLVYPRAAKISTVSIATMKTAGEITVGAVPVDLAFSSHMLAIADPSAKRVWMIERQQSLAQAFAQGFLRGLLGLGLSPGNRDFPTGIDRVIARGSRIYAFDSSTGTLYDSKKAIAKSIAPEAFSVGPGGVYVWSDAVRRLQRLEEDE